VFLSEADEGGLVLDVVLLDVLPEPVNFSLTFLVQLNLGARLKNFFSLFLTFGKNKLDNISKWHVLILVDYISRAWHQNIKPNGSTTIRKYGTQRLC
jgi:hypothetical protein